MAAHSGERVALRRALRTRIRRIDAMTNTNDRYLIELGDPIEIEVEIVNRGNRPATLAVGPLASSFAFAVRGFSTQAPVFTGPLGIRTLPLQDTLHFRVL